MAIVHQMFIPWREKAELNLPSNAVIRNAVITEADVEWGAFCGAAITLRYESEGGVGGYFLAGQNDARWLGYVINAIFKTVVRESGDKLFKFSSLVGRPIRVISRGIICDGIGNFIEDRWLTNGLIEEWIEDEIVVRQKGMTNDD